MLADPCPRRVDRPYGRRVDDGTATYRRTRRCLHGLAELVLAGPRFRQTGELRLRVRPGGIRTWDDPVAALEGGELVTPHSRFPVQGLTIAQVCERAGLQLTDLDDVYTDGPHVDPAEVLDLDESSLRVALDALATGDEALRAFQPAAEPILWPEHFDVAITVAQVNYGVSPGDDHEERPYAYVGPHEARERALLERALRRLPPPRRARDRGRRHRLLPRGCPARLVLTPSASPCSSVAPRGRVRGLPPCRRMWSTSWEACRWPWPSCCPRCSTGWPCPRRWSSSRWVRSSACCRSTRASRSTPPSTVSSSSTSPRRPSSSP